jgi:hypothetical protein
MSQALAQSATQLAVGGVDDITLPQLVEKNATKSIKGVTRERLFLNRSKLFATCAAELLSRSGTESAKQGGRLPAELADRLYEEVDAFIQRQINRINPQNSLSFRRAWKHNKRDMSIVDRITAIGENNLTLEDQNIGCNTLLHDLDDREARYYASNKPDIDKERQFKEYRAALQLTKQHILACISKLKEATKE